MYRLLVRCEPTAVFQHLYVLDKDSIVDQLGVKLDMLNEIAFEYIKKYNITKIDLSGARLYMQGIERSMREYGLDQYDNNTITYRYV